MTEIDHIRKQLLHIAKRTKHIFDAVDEEHWYTVPSELNTSMAWQAGHLVISRYFNAIACITGPDRTLYEVFPIRDYVKMYGIDSDPSTAHEMQPTKAEFMDQLDGVLAATLKVLDSIDDSILGEEPAMKHPAYRTKGDILHWSYMHEAWHLGQVAMLRRVLGVPFGVVMPK
jgi:uncharacterized damage-inducible protein DinB